MCCLWLCFAVCGFIHAASCFYAACDCCGCMRPCYAETYACCAADTPCLLPVLSIAPVLPLVGFSHLDPCCGVCMYACCAVCCSCAAHVLCSAVCAPAGAVYGSCVAAVLLGFGLYWLCPRCAVCALTAVRSLRAAQAFSYILMCVCGLYPEGSAACALAGAVHVARVLPQPLLSQLV